MAVSHQSRLAQPRCIYRHLVYVPYRAYSSSPLSRRTYQFVVTSTGLILPALPNGLADGLTLLTIAGVSILLVVRVSSPLVRTFTRKEDYIVLIMILLPFLTGFAAGSSWNPLSYNLMLLLHILSAEALMIAIPFTKLSHCIFFPFTRFCADLGSKLVSDSDYLYKSPLSKGSES